METSRRRKKEYPTTPHTGTGTSKNIDKELCETISQLIDFDTAQKLAYIISV